MIDSLEYHLPLSTQTQRKNEHSSCSKQANTSYTKKKVGDYAYYLNDQIGSGYSSQVYKCHQKDNPNTLYAIKVVKLSKISKANHHFLQNQIKILQGLNHPNIIKFHQVYYTQNNCYLITDYCEGGTLQECIDNNVQFNWENVITQLLNGCKYLAENLVVHRDIKPANVFLQDKTWKIGDFGFARYLQNKETQVKEIYKVGSPLYMPPETLNHSIYSLKTDSFALGVLFFYMLTKKFPWPGSTNKQLQQLYQACNFPAQLLETFPFNVQNLIRNLCNPDISQRTFISNASLNIKQMNVFFIKRIQHPKATTQIRKFHSRQVSNPENQPSTSESLEHINKFDKNLTLKEYYKEQFDLDAIHRLKLLKFVHYLNINIKQNGQVEYLCEKMEKMLKSLILIYGWGENASFTKYVDEFTKKQFHQFERVHQLKELKENIESQIQKLGNNKQNLKLVTVRMKFIQFNQILRLILIKNGGKLKQFLSKVILHPDFSKVFLLPAQVQQIQKLIKPKVIIQ